MDEAETITLFCVLLLLAINYKLNQIVHDLIMSETLSKEKYSNRTTKTMAEKATAVPSPKDSLYSKLNISIIFK